MCLRPLPLHGPILQEILRPFLLVCESKNPRLIGTVLGSIQKLLAHNAVSDEGRTQIIQAMQQVNTGAAALAGVHHTQRCCSTCMVTTMLAVGMS